MGYTKDVHVLNSYPFCFVSDISGRKIRKSLSVNVKSLERLPGLFQESDCMELGQVVRKRDSTIRCVALFDCLKRTFYKIEALIERNFNLHMLNLLWIFQFSSYLESSTKLLSVG